MLLLNLFITILIAHAQNPTIPITPDMMPPDALPAGVNPALINQMLNAPTQPGVSGATPGNTSGASPSSSPQLPDPANPRGNRATTLGGSTGSPTSTEKIVVVDPTPKGSLRDPLAVISTSMGKIKIRLFETIVPRTVRNFVELANGEKEFTDARSSKRVRRPFYNGLIFHRVVKNFLIQGGCPFGTGRGGPGFTLPDEFDPRLNFDKPGIVAMASARNVKGEPDANTVGSQFFITLAPMPDLDKKHTIIGEVISGMDVVKKIANTKIGPTDRPIKRVYILNVDINEKN